MVKRRVHSFLIFAHHSEYRHQTALLSGKQFLVMMYAHHFYIGLPKELVCDNPTALYNTSTVLQYRILRITPILGLP